jgi:hypothetical protein
MGEMHLTAPYLLHGGFSWAGREESGSVRAAITIAPRSTAFRRGLGKTEAASQKKLERLLGGAHTQPQGAVLTFAHLDHKTGQVNLYWLSVNWKFAFGALA